MKMLILDDGAREALVAINELTPGRQVSPVPLADGRWAVNADLLEDPENWREWQTILRTGTVEEIGAGKLLRAAGLVDAPGLAAIGARYAAETARVAAAKQTKAGDKGR